MNWFIVPVIKLIILWFDLFLKNMIWNDIFKYFRMRQWGEKLVHACERIDYFDDVVAILNRDGLAMGQNLERCACFTYFWQSLGRIFELDCCESIIQLFLKFWNALLCIVLLVIWKSLLSVLKLSEKHMKMIKT